MSNHGGNTYTGELLLTQDIMDTGCILQIRNALPIIEENIKKIRKICMKLAREYQGNIRIHCNIDLNSNIVKNLPPGESGRFIVSSPYINKIHRWLFQVICI